MTKTAEKLNHKYQAMKALNNKLISEIQANGGIAVGLTATFFMNASKELAKIERQIRTAVYNGKISNDEYKIIFQ